MLRISILQKPILLFLNCTMLIRLKILQINQLKKAFYVTPLVNNRECAYVFYDEKGVTKCAIEKAHIDGKIDFKKPISCHLFPVRLNKYSTFTAVNIQSLDICQAAFTCGNKLQVPVYRFLKEPLIRKFGNDWFEALDAVAKG